jgi:hypothetical protein
MYHAPVKAPSEEENKRLQQYSNFEYEPSCMGEGLEDAPHHYPTSQLNRVHIFKGTGTRDIIQIF